MNDTTEADDATPDRRHTAERARFVITIAALRGALEEQPNANAVRNCVRRWIAAAAQAADEVVRDMQDKKKEADQ